MDIKITKEMTIEEEVLSILVNKVIGQVIKKLDERAMSKWIDGAEAMAILKITSKTTLQKLRDTGAIRFSQPKKSFCCMTVTAF